MTLRRAARRAAATWSRSGGRDPPCRELLEGEWRPGIELDAFGTASWPAVDHILVDEYQDIDAIQYRPISALAGRTREEGKLTLWPWVTTTRTSTGSAGPTSSHPAVSGGLRGQGPPPGGELSLERSHRRRGERADRPQPGSHEDRSAHPDRLRRSAQPPAALGVLDPLAPGGAGAGDAGPRRQAAALVGRIQELRRPRDAPWSSLRRAGAPGRSWSPRGPFVRPPASRSPGGRSRRRCTGCARSRPFWTG